MMQWNEQIRTELGQEAGELLADDSLPFITSSIYMARRPIHGEQPAYSFATRHGHLSENNRHTTNLNGGGIDVVPHQPFQDAYIGQRPSLSSDPLHPDSRNLLARQLIGTHRMRSLLAITMPSDRSDIDIRVFDAYVRQREPMLTKLMKAVHSGILEEPLDEALLANEPTTPNAVVIGVDHIASTVRRKENYPLLKKRIRGLAKQVVSSIDVIDGRVATHNGDGKNFVVPIPPAMRFSIPLTEQFKSDVSDRLAWLKQETDVRSVITTGYVTVNKDTADTSSVFWDIDEVFKRRPIRAGDQ